ncbi:hypothetical protein LAZ67_2001127 [Cordylochernes scorpioides]|uniref:protein-serine/threonine phosphatase n=1 Tax=Cordylochernes scorpioides TaxID=51811 RepID=A0ABY6K1S0_9ARAC|nr:hypothetical protein LAZ67_2001127 [Cordylochernes scorpioides]
MEDAHTHLLSLTEDKDAAFFAVYDGHGGDKVAQYAGNHVHKKIVTHPSYNENMRDELAGTTAVIVMVKENKIFCVGFTLLPISLLLLDLVVCQGNVGDSRAIASVNGHVQQLSFDHKPSNEGETKRIIAAGGWVEFNRVNAYPDVVVKDLTPEHEFIVLACDGIWDVMTNEEVVEFIRTRIAAGMDPEQICEELMTRCLAPDCQMGGLGCDNMTVVLVCVLQKGTYEELSARCALPPCPAPADSDNDTTEEDDISDVSASPPPSNHLPPTMRDNPPMSV